MFKSLITCPRCAAAPFKPCVTRKGNKTSPHEARIEQHFSTPDAATAIRRVLNDVYGDFLAEALTPRIDQKWLEPGWSHVSADGRDEMMMYIWMNSSGGSTAEYAAYRIRFAVDTFYRTR